MTSPSAENQTSPTQAKKKSKQVIFGVLAIVGVVGIGTTLAANINLNGGQNVEFGQGVTQTLACDNQITITPRSKFLNRTLNGFAPQDVLDEIEISGLDLSDPGYNYQIGDYVSQEDQDAHPGQYIDYDGNWKKTCHNKKFIIQLYTKQSAYVDFTVDGNINSPLAINQRLVPSGVQLANRSMLISAYSGQNNFNDCYAQAVNLQDNTGWNYNICYENNYITHNSGIHSSRDNETLHYVVTDNPSTSNGQRYFNDINDYNLYVGVPSMAVDSIVIQSRSNIPNDFN
jgi:hypothetical protein